MSFLSKRMDRQIEAYQRDLIDTHYREVDNMYRQIRGWRHDYRNHIQAMKALAASGDMDGIKDYLEQLDTDLQTVDTVVKTGNPMADAIINSKISLAKTRKIPVKIGIAGGGKKVHSVIGAIRGGFINVLITNAECARELIRRM
jgi:sensor histidine kinase YesM